ncbi:MAG: zinc ribbon domain-containing protein, partial [Thermoplasmata archaeon]
RACPSCRAPNPPEGKFCRNCGQPLPQTRSCPNCGKEPEPGVKFCGSCGTRLA